MHDGLGRRLAWLCLGLLGCASDAAPPAPDQEALAQQIAEDANRGSEAEQVQTGLTPATSCTDLLARIQDDAVAKLRMLVAQAKQSRGQGGASDFDPSFGGAKGGIAAPSAGARAASDSAAPSAPSPTSASTTNNQVAGVDEADFVKVVNAGKAMYLLHGSTLRRLTTWPPEQTALTGKALLIEGTPSEMFVTDAGRAVVFSSVAGYGTGPSNRYARSLKITVVDVSGADPKTERELYYEGAYVSSRRYQSETSDLVRVVVRANIKYAGTFLPSIQYTDPWGRPYDAKEIDAQLADFERRVTQAIRTTDLTNWLPDAFEVQDGQLVRSAPSCNAYFVPPPGVADYGITQVLALDVARAGQPVAGVTVLGGSSTVYSNAARMVLAQPDYRWSRWGGPNRQQTALHVFDLAGGATRYAGSGWVPGTLPASNPQFGLDVARDGTVRIASTGNVRTPATDAASGRPYWQYRTESQVLTARTEGGRLAVIGRTPNLGHEGESVHSARFLGDRAYVVTYRQVDPLIVVDVAKAASPSVIGEIQIPGFSEYIHPLDERHLITVGRSGSGGMQLQLFDVTSPQQIPPPKLLDFGPGTSSAVSSEHKAFTLFDGVLAVPISGFAQLGTRRGYYATLQLARVDAQAGFTALGSVDHASLYADNGAGILCGFCDRSGCFDYSCPYEAEVRRGAFVKSGNQTYVYSFSNAGVLVNDVSKLTPAVARVGLPAPIASNGPWFALPGASAAEPDAEPDAEPALPALPPSRGPVAVDLAEPEIDAAPVQ